MTTDQSSAVEFFFDPGCPWTWNTSRWLIDAAGQLGLAVTWRTLSLAVLNAGQEVSEEHRNLMATGFRLHRIVEALRAEGENEVAGRLYTEYGLRLHCQGQEPNDDLIKDAVVAAGADDWLDAADDASHDAAIEASTNEAIELAGPDIGSPVMAFGDPRRAFFGPIVSPPPTGEQAVVLFEAVAAASRVDGFYELKRGRSGPPAFAPAA